ncbi:MAG: antibiotic biosynthesis monooxygenase [Actinobacteria bacterium]|uniref:Unannotated protein n=1 Tax=freshwater metagenome TaxID=449393 RepID=A0A6J6NRL2_9ZZZZ|nr:antibiotic biosynthesis monooxygenase [Actinomycetota bacterium]
MTDLPADALRVVATLPVQPEHVAAARTALAALAAVSLAQDEGCLQYDAFESGTVPGTLVTVEAWTTQAAMDAHMSAPHVAEAFTVVGPLLAGDVAIHTLSPL